MKIKKPENIKQKDWDDVDIPELTAEDFKKMRPAAEIVPQIVKAYKEGRLRGRPKSATTKKALYIRLSADVVEFFKTKGRGWQTRIDEALKEYVKSHM